MNEASLSALQFFVAIGSLLMIYTRTIVNRYRTVYHWIKLKRDPKILYRQERQKKKKTQKNPQWSMRVFILVLVTMEYWYNVWVWDSVIIHLLSCDQTCEDRACRQNV